MAEFTKPKSPFAEYKRELILTIVLGFGSVVFSLGSFLLYAAPPQTEVQIKLAAREATSPRETLARRSQREAGSGPSARPDTRALATEAATPRAAAPTAAVSSSRSETAAAAPVLAAAPARPEKPSNERVRTIRTRIGGEWVEVQDFTHGVRYTGEIHDFSGGTVPRSIRERERATQ
jgi:hypothetical protein